MFGKYLDSYTRLPRDEKELNSFDAPTSEVESREREGHTTSRPYDRIYFWFLHLLVVLLGGLLLFQRPSRCSAGSILLSAELPFARDSTEYVDTTFIPGGFVDGPPPENPYIGPPTPARDAAWESLYDVGMLVMSAEEAAQLSISTTGLVNDKAEVSDSQYLVTVEVFHQLHCLDYLRHASYAADGGYQHHANESDWSRTNHIGHCADYLRQAIQCHADLTPIALEAVPGVPALPLPNPPPYKPDFAIQHTCRNFDKIYDFALQRNSSGYKVA